MKNVSILGSTGSIGRNTLDVIRGLPEDYKVISLSANRNVELLIHQIREFKPKYVSIGTEEGLVKLSSMFPKIKVYFANDGLKNIGELEETDILVTAVSGSVGLEATLSAIKKGKRIGLANKETMVAAGELINELLEEYDAEIIPIDSEHSAIFQALEGNKINEVENLILTASGGPFRGKKSEELREVSVEDALAHPNWSMGSKISIDSATLVNKGLEVIEAHNIFGIDYDKIKVVVHPQSVVHSMVEYCDSSIIAQMGMPDMKVPIQYALTYPDRNANKRLSSFDLVEAASTLTFEKPDNEVFKGLDLAFYAGKEGGTMPAVYNAANEVAVALFLQRKIGFLDIYIAIEEAMKNHEKLPGNKLENILSADREARHFVMSYFRK